MKRAALTIGLFLWTFDANAQSTKETCAQASEAAQLERIQGRLASARKSLVACSQEQCPVVVRKDCLRWLAEVEPTIPSVVFSATDAQGRDLVDVVVKVDGVVVTRSLDGAEQELDAGAHEFSFEAPGHGSAEQKAVIKVGERHRVVSVKLAPPVVAHPDVVPPPPPTAHEDGPSGRRIASYVLGGVGVVAIGGFIVLGLGAQSRYDDLQGSCGHSCAQSEVDSVRSRALVADISLGVGVVALAAGLFLFFTDDHGRTAGSGGAWRF